MELPNLPDKSIHADGTIDNALFIDEMEEYFEAQVMGDILRAISSDTPLAAYILISCAIDCLASWWRGQDSSRETYRDFVNEFFSGLYNGVDLYRDLRCRLVHNYTVGERLILCWDEPDMHRSSMDTGETILNLDQFFEEFCRAKRSYFIQARTDPQLQEALIRRWEEVGVMGARCAPIR